MPGDSMIDPEIEVLLDKVTSKFELVTLASMRARQINDYLGQLGGGIGSAIPPQVSSVARKPLSIAFEEIAQDKIVVTHPTPEELAALAAAEADAAGILGSIEGGETPSEDA